MKKLEKTFIGTGEVKGFEFEQVFESEKAYMYRVDNERYEVFMKKIQKAGEANFGGNKVILEEKELYPKSTDFGKTAWAYRFYDHAIKCFNRVSNR